MSKSSRPGFVRGDLFPKIKKKPLKKGKVSQKGFPGAK